MRDRKAADAPIRGKTTTMLTLSRPVLSSEALAPLTERLAAMTAPCPMHPSVHRIEAAVITWSRELGLEAVPGADAHRLAGRALAGCDAPSATLFARWLVWAGRFREEPAARAGVLAVAGGGDPGPHVVERAFADLWRVSAPGMSEGWRERFRSGLAAQHTALPAPRDAVPPAPRRPAPPVLPDAALSGAGRDRTGFGTYLLDLVEPCLGVEVPVSVAGSPQWRAVTEASGDVAAWCDLLAAGRVPAAAGERTPDGVVERIVTRMEELWTAARAVPALVERRGLDFAASAEVTRVTCAFLTVSRAYLERLLEAGTRYAAQTRESPTGVRL
ncbi:hypothetical protein [Planobispora rosea]|nr:hypothetical protein [Planobispora rosea]